MRNDPSGPNTPKAASRATNYLFKIWHRGILVIVGALYIGHLLYVIHLTNTWKITPENLYTPYSTIILTLIIIVALSLVKRPNWKVKIKIITLIATLSFVVFNTYSQLGNLFDQGTQYINSERARNADGKVLFDNRAQMSLWIKNELQFEISYRIWKILLLDLIAIFGFYAINKILDSYTEDKK